MTAAEHLVSSGWIQQPDGRWQSPLTHRDYPERVALLLARMPTLTTLSNVQRKPRRARFTRR